MWGKHMLSQNKISKAEAEPYIIIVNIKEKVLKIILSYIVCVGVSFGHRVTGHQKQQVPSVAFTWPSFWQPQTMLCTIQKEEYDKNRL